MRPYVSRPTPAAPGLPIVDWPNALRAAQGDPVILRSMVEAALEEIPRQMAAIRESIGGVHPTAWRISAHTLKGGLHYFTLGEAFRLAARLENWPRRAAWKTPRPCWQPWSKRSVGSCRRWKITYGRAVNNQ